jgi:hypothetical protein
MCVHTEDVLCARTVHSQHWYSLELDIRLNYILVRHQLRSEGSVALTCLEWRCLFLHRQVTGVYRGTGDVDSPACSMSKIRYACRSTVPLWNYYNTFYSLCLSVSKLYHHVCEHGVTSVFLSSSWQVARNKYILRDFYKKASMINVSNTWNKKTFIPSLHW